MGTYGELMGLFGAICHNAQNLARKGIRADFFKNFSL
jgi:hypothetical protein